MGKLSGRIKKVTIRISALPL